MSVKISKSKFKKILLYSLFIPTVSSTMLTASCNNKSNKEPKKLLLNKLQAKSKIIEDSWKEIQSKLDKTSGEYIKLQNQYNDFILLKNQAFLASASITTIEAAINKSEEFIQDLFSKNNPKVKLEDAIALIDEFFDKFDEFKKLLNEKYITPPYESLSKEFKAKTFDHNGKKYNIFSEGDSFFANVLTPLDYKKYFEELTKVLTELKSKASYIVDDTNHNNTPSGDESFEELVEFDEILEHLKEKVKETWNEYFSKNLKSNDTFDSILSQLRNKLKKVKLEKKYTNWGWQGWEEYVDLHDDFKNQKVDFSNHSTFKVTVFLSELELKIITTPSDPIKNPDREKVEAIWNKYIKNQTTDYQSTLVVFNRLRKKLKETYPNIKIFLNPLSDPTFIPPAEEESNVSLSIWLNSEELNLDYGKISPAQDKPTKFKEKNGKVSKTNQQNLEWFREIDEILEIGYYKDKNGVVRAPKMPRHLHSQPNQLPEEITSLQYMFADAKASEIIGISHWDTSNITNMRNMFHNATHFNQPIGSWDTSNVTDMSWMFENAVYFNQDISNWDTLNVTNMSYMFYGTEKFNQDISTWNTKNVTNMEGMFGLTKSFNQPIGKWNTSRVKTMFGMFQNAQNFNQDLSDWSVSQVENMSHMFAKTILFNGNISRWNTKNVTNMESMFKEAKAFNQDISDWNVSQVENMTTMFYYASSFNQNISSWDVSSINGWPYLFSRGANRYWSYDKHPKFK
ncbi:Hypothetical protein, predicted lipoprotein, DUF285 family [Metamycoplasma alkalescens 14918]|uniref:Lipoprotein n=1 Tax=Metamycoplasma alkalescens 14918 TaxID=1188234 RepID=N9UA77_9BACT|nr:BspA family leucine-rich repeat surface protein [Metamycoplasma alkalescens]ENY53626.1 Hypothetical protein, predicted lipoprotein, DUF285 family [Metamycoplasma alkalescens 14918]